MNKLPASDYSRQYTSAYVPDLTGITDMQRRFCQEYLIDLDPRMAAIRAGYPPERAKYAAAQIMKHPPCRDLIANLMAQRSKRVGITAERVLDRLGALAFGDARNLYNADGSIKKPGELSADDALMLAGMKTRRTVTLGEDGKMVPEVIEEIKHIDNLAALTLVMKHLGMLNEKIDINVTHALADRINAAHRRIAKGGPVIDGECEEEIGRGLLQLEEQTRVLQREVVHESRRAPELSLADIW